MILLPNFNKENYRKKLVSVLLQGRVPDWKTRFKLVYWAWFPFDISNTSFEDISQLEDDGPSKGHSEIGEMHQTVVYISPSSWWLSKRELKKMDWPRAYSKSICKYQSNEVDKAFRLALKNNKPVLMELLDTIFAT